MPRSGVPAALERIGMAPRGGGSILDRLGDGFRYPGSVYRFSQGGASLTRWLPIPSPWDDWGMTFRSGHSGRRSKSYGSRSTAATPRIERRRQADGRTTRGR